jgi:CRP-like cAMP-binding protein
MSAEFLNQLHLLEGLSPEQRELVYSLLEPCDYEEGSILFEQGEPADNLYLVLDGEITVQFKPDDGPALIVARVGPQGVVGWSAALGSPEYTSGAICTTDCKMLCLSGVNLRDLCENYPETGTIILERLAAVISERLTNTHTHVIALLEQGLNIQRNSTLPQPAES